MPRLETYVVEVTVEVVLRSNGREVSRYQVSRDCEGQSAPGGVSGPAENMTKIVEGAMVKTLAAEKALRAGMQNAEVRRLK